MDDQQLIKFEKIDGRIKCGKKAYVQFIIRSLDLSVTNLALSRTYNNEFLVTNDKGALVRQKLLDREFPILKRQYDQKDSRVRLFVNGIAHLDRDTLRVIGDQENSTKELEITFEELEEGSEDFSRFAWKANIYFSLADWEFDTTDSWFMTIYVPTSVFRDIVLETEESRPHKLSLRLDTDLWAEASAEHVPGRGALNWYLAPNEDGRLDRAPETAHGVVTSLGWGDVKRSSDDEVGEPIKIEGSTKQTTFREVISALYVVAGAIFILALVIYWKQ